MTPYASGDRWTLYQGDALAVLPTLDTGSVGLLATDPPYSSGGAFRGDRTADTNTKYLRSDSAQSAYLPQFGGDNRDQRAYLTWCALWLGECLRIVRPGRAAVLFTDWRQLPTTTDALQLGGWVWRGIAPWIKPSARPQMGRIAAAAEFAVWGTAGPSADDTAVGCIRGYHLASSPAGADREHVTQKPEGVMAWLMPLCPADGVVLDPFVGSGTTGVAALVSGRRFIGIEREPAYLDVAARRLTDAEESGHQTTLFGAP